MIKVENKMKYAYLFEEYTHNRPVIYSALEGQYESELYVDDIKNPEIGILFTQFDFHFITGNRGHETVVSELIQVIFKDYLKKNNSKEAIVVTPDERWQTIMADVFKGYSEIVDKRYVYKLNHEKFNQIYDETKNNSEFKLSINQEAEMKSTKPYSVSRLKENHKSISYCSGFMIGGGHAEIDVKTDEKHRQKGYGKLTSLHLIKELLGHNIEPDWCCWANKVASQKLAESIGFEKVNEVPVYIWVEEENGKL